MEVHSANFVCRLCNKERIPVIPFGTGTGLEGGVGAVKVKYNTSIISRSSMQQ